MLHALAWDTAPFIYFTEDHPHYAEKMDVTFQFVGTAGIAIKASVIVLTETLTKPTKAGDQSLIDAYLNLFTESDTIELISITPESAKKLHSYAQNTTCGHQMLCMSLQQTSEARY